MILQIPHSSDIVPDQLREQITLSDQDLSAELTLMTDRFTYELFDLPRGIVVRFPIFRLIVDVERFLDDTEEPMTKVGMGMIYTRTAYGRPLRRPLDSEEKKVLVSQYYQPHHETLVTEVEKELDKWGKALIVDCHSFPSKPLPCDVDQTIPRPDFCIGTDPFYTPKPLLEITEAVIEKMGYNVTINWPYSGTLVPIPFYKKDQRVESIMIEVNRRLYMDELTGEKIFGFDVTKGVIHTLLGVMDDLQGDIADQTQQ